MKKKKILIIILLLMIVGFATVATTLFINGNVLIGSLDSEFDESVIFTKAYVKNGNASISQNGKTITFETADLKTLNDVSTLEYTITNNSTQYDASVEIVCDFAETTINSDKKYINWIYNLSDIVRARRSEDGTINVKLIEVVTEEKEIKIACTIQALASERESLGENLSPIIPEYSLSGIAKMKSGNEINSLTEGNLVFFSDNHIETVIGTEGDFTVEGLELGSHDVYYMGTQDISNMTKNEIKENAIGYARFVTTTNETTIILECINNKCPNNTEFMLDELELEVDPDTIPKSPGIYDLDGNMIVPLTVEDIEKEYTGQYGQKIDFLTYKKINKTTVGEVVVPEGTKNLGYKFLNGCTNLTNVTLPSTLETISSNSFSNCSSLESIEIPQSVTTIGESSFSGCVNLKSIIIPDGVTQINQSTFSGCTNLKLVKLSNNLVEIGSNAFYNCTSLESIGLPNSGADVEVSLSLNSIGSNAFSGCNGLKFVVLPDTIENIGESAFLGCTSLETAKLSSNLATISNYMFKDCISLSSIGVIGSGASIEIPSSVTSIGQNSFYNCTGLTTVEIPGNVKTIGQSAFMACNNVTNLTLNEGLQKIDQMAFNSLSIENLYIPSSVTSIAESNQYGLSSPFVFNKLTAITVSPDNEYYSSLDGILYDKNQTKIIKVPEQKKLVTIPSTVTTIGAGAFAQCRYLSSISIPDTVTSIEYSAFSECKNLTTVVLSSNITTIPGRTFEDCSKLTSIDIPNGVTSIESNAFINCYSLTSAIIPNTVTTIGYRAFSNCYKLNTTIPTNVTTISANSFEYVANVNYSGTNKNTPFGAKVMNGYLEDGYIYTSSSKTILNGYYGDNTVISVPSTVKSISKNAFEKNTTITEIILPEGLTTIEDKSFYNTENLQTIYLPSSLKTIGSQVFYNTKINSLTIPNNVTSIGYKAFANIEHIYYNGTATGSPWGAKNIN